jgi:dihydrofolate synthase/folylpolyglutamate synthase
VLQYQQAIDFLNSRIPVGWKLGLDSMNRMLDELGNPHHNIKFVHIAGTNGKGSVASMLASIFYQAGYKTGLYTSPHLVDVRERLQINGAKIDEQTFSRLIEQVKPTIEKYNATYFELLTTLAFLYFAAQKTNIVVLETGLGGRLDATNVVNPDLSIITSIDFDHTDHLGKTLIEIAGEKAGIIKTNRPCLTGGLPDEARFVIQRIAQERQAPFYNAEELYQFKIANEKPGQTDFSVINKKGETNNFSLALSGRFQVANACIAISACDILNSLNWHIEHTHIKLGLKHVSWPGRFQILQQHPTIILDVAHNPASMRQLVHVLTQFYSDKKIYFCLGMLKDKDSGEMAKAVAEIAHTVQPVEVKSDRALAAQELQSVLQHFDVHVLPPKSLSMGLNYLFSILDEESVLCITGSHYVVGEALERIKGLTK